LTISVLGPPPSHPTACRWDQLVHPSHASFPVPFTLARTDHSIYLRPDFSPHDLSAAILANEPYPPPSSEKTASSQPGSRRPSAAGGAASSSKSGAVEKGAKSLGVPRGEGGGGGGDVSAEVTIARLSYGIDEVARQLKSEVRCVPFPLLSLYQPYKLT
jgi:hypothetical protein